MIPFQVKVCGLTRPEDVRAAVRHGADMIGFIFYRKSPRYVSMTTAAKLSRETSPITDRVGVFVDCEHDQITKIADRVGLQWVQLHRTGSRELVSKLQDAGLRVIECYHISKRDDYAAVYESAADLVMLDNATVAQPGGTGRTFNWSIKPPRRIPNLMLAGGLNVDNLADGIRRFKPVVVDVNSGVETAPGKKSIRKLKAFMQHCYHMKCEDSSNPPRI